jgi:hypothetical protein
MVSVVVTVMIFAESSLEALSAVRFAFAVLPLLLAVLLFASGMLATPKKGDRILSDTGILFLFVSFAVGALFGSLIIPFTRAKYPGEPSVGNIYTVFPGIYFFMYSSTIAVALLVVMAPYIFQELGLKPKK